MSHEFVNPGDSSDSIWKYRQEKTSILLLEHSIFNLTHWVLPPYRNQSIDLHVKSIDWFLHEGNTGTQWVKHVINVGRHVDFHKGRFQYLLTGHSFSRLLRTHTVAQPEPSQTSKMENFATIINDYSPLTVVAKFFILDVCVGPCYVSEIISYFTSGYLHTLL